MTQMSFGEFWAKSNTTSLAFETVGTSYTGVVSEVEMVQATDFNTGELLTWQSGEPRMQTKFTLDTTLRDPSNPQDDGKRSLWVKMWGAQWKSFKAAMAATRMTDVPVGTQITVTYVADGEPHQRGQKAPKLYQYELVGPVGVQAAGGQPVQQSMQQQVPPPQPAQQQPVQQQMTLPQPAQQQPPQQQPVQQQVPPPQSAQQQPAQQTTFDAHAVDAMLQAGVADNIIQGAQPVDENYLKTRREALGLPPF